jgi:hypothetical protein
MIPFKIIMAILDIYTNVDRIRDQIHMVEVRASRINTSNLYNVVPASSHII